MPRLVQVGEGDELYPSTSRAPRPPPIWPGTSGCSRSGPPSTPPSIATGAAWRRSSRSSPGVVTDSVGPARFGTRRVPPPRLEPPLAGWRTFKLFGASAGQDALLTGTVVPTVAEARAKGEIDAWFSLRYLDGPGERPHLRLRVRGQDGDEPAAFEQRLRAALRPARAAGTFT